MLQRDDQLIAEFSDLRSEQAFVALLERHLNLVFATALRLVGDRGIAEEITQSVFVTLAQSAGKLGRHPTIAGWLYQTTLNKSRERLRSELRRHRREQIAVKLETAEIEGDSVWSALVPLLDEALLELRETDRLAVIMHFMEEQSFREVGAVLGVGEDAARKRIDRCLDQLTAFFRKRGFAVPVIAAGTPLFAFSSQAVPIGLAASVTTASLAAAPAVGASVGLGAMNILGMTKLQITVVSVIVAAGVTTPLVLQHQSLNRLRHENQTLHRQVGEVAQLREEAERLSKLAAQSNALTGEQLSELLRLRGQVGLLRQQTNELATLRREKDQLRANLDATQRRASQIGSPGENEVATAKAVIFNPATAIAEKLTALQILRFADARSDDVVKQMVQAYRSTRDPDARADIFRQLSGVTTPELKLLLLESFRDETNTPKVREEAAETLANYLADPDVKTWLEHLTAHDPDAKVRAQAGKSLQSSQRSQGR